MIIPAHDACRPSPCARTIVVPRLCPIKGIFFLFALFFLWVQPCDADVAATYNSAGDVPITEGSFSATGATFSASLNFAPPTGTNLTVVNNTGLGFVTGTFSNLAQGQAVTLTYSGINYHFIANYFGGTGNDLVLQWARSRPVAWGANDYGQIGDGSTTNRLVPVNVLSTGVLAGKTPISVAAGLSHSLALCADGTVAAWGANDRGQLGNYSATQNTTVQSLVPVAVNSSGVLAGKRVVSVAAGQIHSLALCSDGTVAAWGSNYDGQLGNHNSIFSMAPMAVDITGVLAGKTVVAVAAGGAHSLALCADGTLVAWGSNYNGQLGNDSALRSSIPVRVNTAGVLSGKKVVAVSAGSKHSLALCSDGTVAAWGSNYNGQLGYDSYFESAIPVAVIRTGPLSGKIVVAVAAGDSHSLALCSDGTVAAWGNNESGQLGNNRSFRSIVPVALETAGALSGKTIVGVAASQGSLALCSDGTVATWGGNQSGQLGNNSTTSSSVPVAVSSAPLASGERYVAAVNGSHGSHSLGLIALPAVPLVTTFAATNLTATNVTLNGLVIPNGPATTAQFEYGTTTSYGSRASLVLSPNNDFSAQNVSANLTGLMPGTTYHYRITATDAFGTSVTPDATLTTVPALTDLVLGTGALSPLFSSDITTYTASVTSGAATFSPTVAGGSSTVKVNGDPVASGDASGVIALGYGVNLAVNIVVTAQDGITTKIYNVTITRTAPNPLAVSYATAADVPFTTNGYAATGITVSLSLNFAPPTGTTLTVVNNTGLDFINGKFSNLAHGQLVTLSYGGLNYRFIANYYGGTGNDLVLQWARSRPAAWGANDYGQIGDGSTTNRLVPVDVLSTGVLADKTVISVAAGRSYSLALCIDGTVAAWGSNDGGTLGNNSTTSSLVPVAVNTDGVLSGKRVVAVAAGANHSLALCSDGTVAAWGYNGDGQLGTNLVPSSSSVPVAVNMAGVLFGKTVIAVAAGDNDSLALCSDGTVAAWGRGYYGELGNNSTISSPVPVAVNTAGVLSGKTVIAVAAGRAHNLALCSDGTVAAWGDGSYGELGNNSTTSSLVPTMVNASGVLSGKTVVAVTAGSLHSLALCSDGTVAAWGHNGYGQLGNNSTAQSNVPVLVGTAGVLVGKTVVSVDAGIYHSLARCSDGTLATWGFNGSAQLGNNSRINSSAPVAVSSPTINGECYAAVFSGADADHNLGLIASPAFFVVTRLAATNVTKSSVLLNGIVNPDGSAATAQFEYGATTAYGSTAAVTLVPNDGLSAQKVSANLTGLPPGTTYHYRFTATNAAGTVSTTDGTFSTSSDVAATYLSASDVPVTADRFSASSATFSATLNFAPPTGTNLMVVKNTGPAFINGTFSNLSQGQAVTLSYGGINYRFIANYHGGKGNDLVLQWPASGLVAWGYNGTGQIGDGSTTTRLVPVSVLSTGVLLGKTITILDVGSSHSLALCADGTIAAWGDNSSGQLGNNSTTASTTPVAVEKGGALSGKTVIGIAAGISHNLALCSDGTVAAWGDNSSGQLGNNSTTQSKVPVMVDTSGVLAGQTVVAVAAGNYYSLALCSDGSVVAWGSNSSGELGNHSTSNSQMPVAVDTAGIFSGKFVIAITAGGSHNLALCSDGTVAAWGSNNYGQLSEVPAAVNTLGVLSGKTVIAVAAGGSHSLALCSDGIVAAWGYNEDGRLGNNSLISTSTPVAVDTASVLFGKRVLTIAASPSQSLALCSDGTMAAWGSNSFGQLGNNTTIQSKVPVAVSNSPLATGERYAAAFSGYARHNLSLIASSPFPLVTSLAKSNLTPTSVTLSGTVNPNGSAATAYFEYGLDTSYGSIAGVSLAPNDGMSAQTVSAGLSGLMSGTTYHYRLTAKNPLSTPSTADGTFTTPIMVAATYNSASEVPVTANPAIAEGGTFDATLNFAPTPGTSLMVVKNTGPGLIVGRFNNLAQGQAVTLSYGGVDYRFFANYYGGTGNDLVLQWAVTRPVAWGYNISGELGINNSMVGSLPVDVFSSGVLAGKSVISAAAGARHSLALCIDGTVVASGSNGSGQLGNNSAISSNVPVAVITSGILAGKTVIALAAGQSHSLALCSDGTVAAWGDNALGQLGNKNSSMPMSQEPVAVSTSGVLAGKMVVAIAAGHFHSLALCSDGTVAAWGFNRNGELGNNNSNSGSSNSPVPVAVNTADVLSGKVVIAVAAGGSHSLALCSDGTVVAWGANTYGSLGNNSRFSYAAPVRVSTTGILSGKTVIGVAAGGSHSLALCSDGTVAAWGGNQYGQLGNNSVVYSLVPVTVGTTGLLASQTVIAVAAGRNHSLALCSDGTVAAWGSNFAFALGNNTPEGQSNVPVVVSGTPLATGERYTAAFTGPAGDHSLGLVASPPFPVAVTLAATNLDSGSAILNGTVNAAGGSATVFFDYGLDTNYGSTVTGVRATGGGDTAFSANLIYLTPLTTYHFRVRATTAGGTTNGTDLTLTTPADIVPPVGGTLTLTPGLPMNAGAALTAAFANWTDTSLPLTYALLIDDVLVSAPGASASIPLTCPSTGGVHILKGRIYDALGYFTEVTQNFTINTVPESWRMLYFGTAENAGAAADLADPDGDGTSNLLEYVSGLVPTNARSRFNVRVELGARQPAIIFSPLVAGRTYSVKYKATLTDPAWTPLADFTANDNGTERTVTDLSPGSGQRFYQVEITLP
ncbi:MAG: hypothetical protein JWL59_3789 [Chthoniobacteraceae bacterium]|nr:hypothetical protein [Chthoniobacteraceae bacterium]